MVNQHSILSKTFFLLAFICITGFGQKSKDSFVTNIFTYPLSDSVTVYTYLFEISEKKIVFERSKDLFIGKIHIFIEARDSNSNLIQRHFREMNVSYTDFYLTTSSSKFIKGKIELLLKNRSWLFNFKVVDANSQREIFSEEKISPERKFDGPLILEPLVVSPDEVQCDSLYGLHLERSGGLIPFDSKPRDLLLLSLDPRLEQIHANVISNKDTLFSGLVNRTSFSNLVFFECNKEVFILNDSSKLNFGFFYIKGITTLLPEGLTKIEVSNPSEFSNKKVSSLSVKWFDKPASLGNAEEALKLLKYVIPQDSVNQLLKGKDYYEKKLLRHWENFDPTPSTKFNEVMAEYYERIDYSNQNFFSITNPKGSETDRAKIYIKLGKPSLVERSSNQLGKMIEIWIYEQLNKRFVFSDERGTGDFVLVGMQ